MTDLNENWRVVRATGEALKYGTDGLKSVLLGLARLIEEEPWREYVHADGTVVRFTSFARFITSTKGLNTTPTRIKSLIASDLELLDRFDQALGSCQGQRVDLLPVNPGPTDVRTGDVEEEIDPDFVDNINEVRPTGTSRQAALRRLRRDAPEFHAKVIAGEMSANRAMIDAGLRPPPPKVRVQRTASVTDIANVLRAQLSKDDLVELLRLLGR